VAASQVTGTTLTSVLTTVPNQTDGLVASLQKEESVYSASWSAADPWVFASVSYDGRVSLGKVAQAERDKILL
jgi:hypothetical protein